MRFLSRSITLACLAAAGTLAVILAAPTDRAALVPTKDLVGPSQRFADLKKAEDPSFRRHVVPLLARAGCSGRECHGSFQGRGGFQLSLFGSEWDADYVMLTQKKGDEDETHINPANPEKSLILLKPTLQIKHKGKERFKKDSWQYNLLLKWISAGAKNDSEQTGELQRLEVTPAEIVFNKIGQNVQLRVLAHWQSGLVEDVTELTRFKTNDETVANVADTGLVSCTGKGDGHIVASYDNGVLPIPVMLPVSDFAGNKFPAIAAHNKVDELVLTKLRKVGIVPAEICTDAEFLRRVSLDLTGTLPTPDEITAFLAEKSAGKRAAKVDELLKSPAYAAWWTTKLCDYTGNSPRQVDVGRNVLKNTAEVSRQWYEWIYKRVANNQPYDKLVSDIVVSSSRSSPTQTYKDYVEETAGYFRAKNPTDFTEHPTMPYYWQRRNARTPEEKALSFSHSFLGVRLECAQCHKHPFDRWTKTDFKQFTAFFATINSAPRPSMPGEDVTYQSVSKEIRDKVAAQIDKDTPDLDAKDSQSDSTKTKLKNKNQTADAKRNQRIQKATQDEVRRRVDAGEIVAWPEVWINSKNLPVQGKGASKFDPTITPKILGGATVDVHTLADARQPLMDWLRSDSNPYFAKAFVNRVWAAYFNRGIVDPPDDMNIANAPSNSDLLNYLAQGFAAHGYDIQWLHREIINSDTYQRSWKTNETNQLDARNFSHAVLRQLPAEVMLDAIDMSIATTENAATFESNVDNRAIGPYGTSLFARGKGGGGGGGVDAYFLNLFGRPTRETNCDCERSADPTLLQTLFTRNDPSLLARIDGNSSWIGELRKSKQIDVDKTIAQVFLRTVSRMPTDQEMTEARADILAATHAQPAGAKQFDNRAQVDAVRDLLWAVLNTREYKVNH